MIEENYIFETTDYYPGGMAMPGRNMVGDYRYAFQGQEKDPKTGREAFELRLWDSRIGRWLTTDPAGQYSSPYLGMGNDPINGIGLDGGWRGWFGKFFARRARNNAIKAGGVFGIILKYKAFIRLARTPCALGAGIFTISIIKYSKGNKRYFKLGLQHRSY
ncbi:hypothetical protein MNBD_BACTEROID03-1238, partial [hydrothermal vent metagenome]